MIELNSQSIMFCVLRSSVLMDDWESGFSHCFSVTKKGMGKGDIGSYICQYQIRNPLIFVIIFLTLFKITI